MSTIYDFVSVTLFAWLAVLFLHRSSRPEPDSLNLWAYGLLALTCASADVIGNHAQGPAAWVLLALAAIGLTVLTFRTLPH